MVGKSILDGVNILNFCTEENLWTQKNVISTTELRLCDIPLNINYAHM
jgi:hypothetical protein